MAKVKLKFMITPLSNENVVRMHFCHNSGKLAESSEKPTIVSQYKIGLSEESYVLTNTGS